MTPKRDEKFEEKLAHNYMASAHPTVTWREPIYFTLHSTYLDGYQKAISLVLEALRSDECWQEYSAKNTVTPNTWADWLEKRFKGEE